MGDKNFGLTVIVPFYNESKTLEKSLISLIDEDIANEIILVDDSSTDNSYQIAKNLLNTFPEIKLLKKPLNEGKGSAVMFAKNEISYSHLIIHDADLEYSPSDIKNLFDISNKNPKCLILGSRTQSDIKRKKIYKTLVWINKIYSIIFSLLNNYKVSDIATCYMLMPSIFFVNNINKEKGFGIEVEILSSFLRTNNKIIEYPISYVGRKYSEGKKIKFKDGVNIFFKIIKYSKFIFFLKKNIRS